MKILYSCLSKSWGGMEMYTLTAVRQLLRRNHHVELLCASGSRLYREAARSGITAHRVLGSVYFNPVFIAKTAMMIRNNAYEVIHTQSSKDLWLLVPALTLAKSNIPLLLTKQVGSYITKKDFLHRWIYNRVTYALGISEVIRKNLLDTCPLPEEKVKLLPNGIDVRLFDPSRGNREKVRKEFGFKDDEIVLGMMARFSPGKGHEEFLYAARVLNGQYPNLRFLIVGEASRGENHYAAAVKNLARDYRLSNVIFTGFRSDTVDVLSALDIFVFPSHAEAFGIALAEAMAMAKPSVCARADGVMDIAVDGVTSLMFERKNGQDLVEKLHPLIRNRNLREQFGRAARTRIVERFDIEILTDAVIEIYTEALRTAG